MKKMSWEEMKENFPNEWLLITDFELNQYGQVIEGVVERHSEKREEINYPPLVDKNTAFRYTGETTFSGLRSHAAHHYAI